MCFYFKFNSCHTRNFLHSTRATSLDSTLPHLNSQGATIVADFSDNHFFLVLLFLLFLLLLYCCNMCHIIINNNFLQQACPSVRQHLLHVFNDSFLDNNYLKTAMAVNSTSTEEQSTSEYTQLETWTDADQQTKQPGNCTLSIKHFRLSFPGRTSDILPPISAVININSNAQ